MEALEKNSKDQNSDLLTLAHYIKNNGNIDVVTINKSITYDRSNGSLNEMDFQRTIAHFCSVYKQFQCKKGVPFKDIFSDDEVFEDTSYEFDFVLYKRKSVFSLNLVPVIAIELDGPEYFIDSRRQYCDMRKKEVCEKKNIELIRVGNRFRKRYEEIKNIIFAAQKVKDYEQLKLKLDEEEGN